MPEFLTAALAAKEVGLSREIIARYCRDGKIQATMLNPRTYLIARADWDAWKKAHKKEVASRKRKREAKLRKDEKT